MEVAQVWKDGRSLFKLGFTALETTLSILSEHFQRIVCYLEDLKSLVPPETICKTQRTELWSTIKIAQFILRKAEENITFGLAISVATFFPNFSIKYIFQFRQLFSKSLSSFHEFITERFAPRNYFQNFQRWRSSQCEFSLSTEMFLF